MCRGLSSHTGQREEAAGTEAQEGNTPLRPDVEMAGVTGGTAAFPKPTRGWPVGEEHCVMPFQAGTQPAASCLPWYQPHEDEPNPLHPQALSAFPAVSCSRQVAY